MLLGMFGEDVRLGSLNPNRISGQNMQFSSNLFQAWRAFLKSSESISGLKNNFTDTTFIVRNSGFKNFES